MKNILVILVFLFLASLASAQETFDWNLYGPITGSGTFATVQVSGPQYGGGAQGIINMTGEVDGSQITALNVSAPGYNGGVGAGSLVPYPGAAFALPPYAPPNPWILNTYQEPNTDFTTTTGAWYFEGNDFQDVPGTGNVFVAGPGGIGAGDDEHLYATVVTPEPTTALLLAAGIVAIGMLELGKRFR